jgi:hypothetical protein
MMRPSHPFEIAIIYQHKSITDEICGDGTYRGLHGVSSCQLRIKILTLKIAFSVNLYVRINFFCIFQSLTHKNLEYYMRVLFIFIPLDS